MFIDLTAHEKDVLKMLAGEENPHITAGCAFWEAVAYLKTTGLIKRKIGDGKLSYEPSSAGLKYLGRQG